jgi:membrane protease YdiL (CAAX protease family)
MNCYEDRQEFFMEPLSSGNVPRSRVLTGDRAILSSWFRRPAVWLFAALYVSGASVYLLLGGPAALVKPLGFLISYALIVLVTIACTTKAPAPAWAEAAPYSRRQLWWQLGAALLFWLLEIGYSFLLFGLVQTLPTRYRPLLALGNVGVLLLLNVGLPLLIMRRLGVPWNELGFGRGYRVWRVMGISCFLPIVVLVIQALIGRGLADIGSALLQVLLQAAFVEEVFYRGILLTRLIRLVGTSWGIVLAALIFGAAHAALNLSQGGDLAAGFAQMIVAQATFGLVAAVLFVRTRTIWAGVAFHALVDGTGL